MQKYIKRNTLSNCFLLFSALILLVWGVNFTLNFHLMFHVLALNYLVMAFIILYPLYKEKPVSFKIYYPFFLYWIWFLYGVARGVTDIESNLTFKFFCDYLIVGMLSLYVFFPNNVDTYFRWIKIFWKIGFVVAILLTPLGVNHSFYFHYLLLIIPFWKYLKKSEKFIILCAITYSLRYLDPRAHLSKYLIELLIFALPNFIIKDIVIKLLHLIFLLLPIGLLITGVTGFFNPFDMESYIDTDIKIEQGGETLDATIDTRTVIYEDVILSAINNDYVWQGRNITNGNDSRFVDYAQRNLNESSVLNHFTKLGLIGLILLFSLFVYTSTLAIYKSNNRWTKLIGLYVAFRWIILWVEDVESFSTLYLSVWLMMGICVSPLRKMSDYDVSKYLKTALK